MQIIQSQCKCKIIFSRGRQHALPPVPHSPTSVNDLGEEPQAHIAALHKAKQHSDRVWNQIGKHRGNSHISLVLLQIANLLEEHTVNIVTLHTLTGPKLPNGSSNDAPDSSPALSEILTSLQFFYQQPLINTSRHLSSFSLSKQIANKTPPQRKQTNHYTALFQEDNVSS